MSYFNRENPSVRKAVYSLMRDGFSLEELSEGAVSRFPYEDVVLSQESLMVEARKLFEERELRAEREN